ncbi:MerR family transcriptional regulator [Butyrivibrio proteoclasticus]|uniref:MerR family transcriptional regulator n=1 Tax=Butyrivibrio proteoclasticus TaxID=43305 RepID=UPI00047A31F8|nr:MerR family transcriptional regulator [Butyrivibrio proteoclasticus]
MKEEMTSGEIAKKAGVSPKALRIYDEKGLLKPVAYSEGNYKLYNKESLMILEKIIALKHVGFSLEEIKESLENDEQESIADTLRKQLELMEKKIYELQKSAQCIKSALARLDENPDWDDVADMIKKMEMSQGADERRYFAKDHAADGIEWYNKIFDSLDFQEGQRVLDLGCSYGLLWRENLDRIPENFTVQGVDIHGNWGDVLDKDLPEIKAAFPDSSDINLMFSNLEYEETWKEIRKKKYSRIVAHYLMTYLNDFDTFLANVASVLKKDGFFSVNYFGNSKEYDYWIKELDQMGVDSSFAKARKQEIKDMQDGFLALLSKYFQEVDIDYLPCPMSFKTAKELYDRLLTKYPAGEKTIEANKDTIMKHFDDKLQKDKDVVVDIDSAFYHCYL